MDERGNLSTGELIQTYPVTIDDDNNVRVDINADSGTGRPSTPRLSSGVAAGVKRCELVKTMASGGQVKLRESLQIARAHNRIRNRSGRSATTRPRFSWRLESDDPSTEIQLAYEIEVDSDGLVI